MYADSFGRTVAILEEKQVRIRKESQVSQVAVGFKVKGGKVTEEVGIVAFVTKKKTLATLRAENIKPLAEVVTEVPTDVIEVPEGFKPRTNWDRHRPFMGGDAGIHFKIKGSGTFGIVTVNLKTKRYEILTNNHVGANSDIVGKRFASKGDAWLQPGAHGGGTMKDKVAELDRWHEIIPNTTKPYGTNLYDVAIGVAIKDDPNLATVYNVRNIGEVRGWEAVNLGDRVMKMGARTELTRGYVQAIFPPGQIVTVGPYQGYYADFENQAVIVADEGPFSAQGDSGSLIVTEMPDSESKRKAKMLLFAGGTDANGVDYTIATPIEYIVRDFGFSLL